jgi:hypothetical protein
MPTLAETVQLRRADDQCRHFVWERVERDSWDVPKSAPRARKAVGACRYCARRGQWRGMCHIHYARWRRWTLE